MVNTRRKFIRQAGLIPMLGLIPNLLHGGNRKSPNEKGFVTAGSKQETYNIMGRQAPVTLMVNKTQHGVSGMSFCKEVIAPDDFIPVHRHKNEDEIVYIQEGKGEFILGSEKTDVETGSIAFVPKGAWHGLKNSGALPLIMIFTYSPAGFEDYFREIGVPEGETWKAKSPEEYDAISLKYGIEYKHSPPGWD